MISFVIFNHYGRVYFQILTTAGEKTVALPDSISLALIRRDICDNPDSEMIIYYRIFPCGLA